MKNVHRTQWINSIKISATVDDNSMPKIRQQFSILNVLDKSV